MKKTIRLKTDSSSRLKGGSIEFRNLSKRQRAGMINERLISKMKPETLGYISSSKSTRIHAFNEALSRVVKGGSLDHVDILFDYGMLHMHSMRPNAGLGFAADQQKIFYIKQGRLA